MVNKLVTYHCPACGQRIFRRLPIASRRLTSVCGATGRKIVMRRIEWHYASAT